MDNLDDVTATAPDGAAPAAAPVRTILKSVCRSCHGGCGVNLHVEDGRLVKVEGDRTSPLNRGRLCPIGTSTLDLVYHPDRLKYPMRRTGARGEGKWERISWDEALDEIARRLQAIKDEHGAQAIALGTGTGRHHIRWVSRFGHALGTPNWCEPGFAQCFHPRINTTILTFGDLPVNDFTSGTKPECIVYWGHNPMNSGPDGETRFVVRDSLAGKPKTIVVDPRRTELAKNADLWLQLRPGTDDALALAMLHVIIEEKLYDAAFVAEWTHGFEALAERVKRYSPEWAAPITWVPAEKIRAAARLYAATKPSMMEWGCAIEHTPNTIQTVRAISMLPALTGNIDVPGGWVFGMKGLGRFPSLIENLTPEMNAKRLGADRFKMLAGEGADLPAAHIPTLLSAMRDGVPYPVKAFLVFGNNTLTTYGNAKEAYEALMKLDLLVVADLFMTPTCELADIVLPAASWPELDQLAALPTIAGNVVLAQRKAVRVGECKADEEIFIELARKMKLPVGTEDLDVVLGDQLARGCGMPLRRAAGTRLPRPADALPQVQGQGLQDPDRQARALLDPARGDGLRPAALLRGAAREPAVHARRGEGLPAGADLGRADPVLLQFRAPPDPGAAPRLPEPDHGGPSGHRGVAGHQARRLGLDRDAARQDPAEGQGHRGHRPSRGPRRARLVVSRGPGSGARRLAVQRQRADAQRAALRPGDGHLPSARIALPGLPGGPGQRLIPVRA